MGDDLLGILAGARGLEDLTLRARSGELKLPWVSHSEPEFRHANLAS